MGRYFCQEISPFWLDNRDVQGRNEVRWGLGQETSLAPHVRTWGLSEANVLFWKKCIWHCCDLLVPSSDSAPAKLCPLHPSLRLWCYSIKIGICSENKLIFMSRRHELLLHEHLQFSNAILHGSCTDCKQRLLVAFHVSSCSFCVTTMPAPRVFFGVNLCLFSNNKTFPKFNKLLF